MIAELRDRLRAELVAGQDDRHDDDHDDREESAQPQLVPRVDPVALGRRGSCGARPRISRRTASPVGLAIAHQLNATAEVRLGHERLLRDGTAAPTSTP